MNVLCGLYVERPVQLWRAQFGHGIDCLTEVEALQLCRQQSIAGIEDFLAKAAIEARSRGLAPTIGSL